MAFSPMNSPSSPACSWPDADIEEMGRSVLSASATSASNQSFSVIGSETSSDAGNNAVQSIASPSMTSSQVFSISTGNGSAAEEEDEFILLPATPGPGHAQRALTACSKRSEDVKPLSSAAITASDSDSEHEEILVPRSPVVSRLQHHRTFSAQTPTPIPFNEDEESDEDEDEEEDEDENEGGGVRKRMKRSRLRNCVLDMHAEVTDDEYDEDEDDVDIVLAPMQRLALSSPQTPRAGSTTIPRAFPMGSSASTPTLGHAQAITRANIGAISPAADDARNATPTPTPRSQGLVYGGRKKGWIPAPQTNNGASVPSSSTNNAITIAPAPAPKSKSKGKAKQAPQTTYHVVHVPPGNVRSMGPVNAGRVTAAAQRMAQVQQTKTKLEEGGSDTSVEPAPVQEGQHKAKNARKKANRKAKAKAKAKQARAQAKAEAQASGSSPAVLNAPPPSYARSQSQNLASVGYNDAVDYVTNHIKSSSSTDYPRSERLPFLQALITELGLLTPQFNKGSTLSMPTSVNAAKNLIRERVNLNAGTYVQGRVKVIDTFKTIPNVKGTKMVTVIDGKKEVGVGVDELQKMMFPTKKALRASLRGKKNKAQMHREDIKAMGLQALMVQTQAQR